MTGDDRNEPGRPPARSLFRRGAAGGRLPSGPSLTRLLREAYASPDDPHYWNRLEARIMAGVRGQTGRGGAEGWGAAFHAWARAGLAAACLAAVAGGVAAWNSRDMEARVAYEAVVDVPTPAVVQSDSRFINVSEREATGRYVFSH
jgi:hypothetical protein